MNKIQEKSCSTCRYVKHGRCNRNRNNECLGFDYKLWEAKTCGNCEYIYDNYIEKFGDIEVYRCSKLKELTKEDPGYQYVTGFTKKCKACKYFKWKSKKDTCYDCIHYIKDKNKCKKGMNILADTWKGTWHEVSSVGCQNFKRSKDIYDEYIKMYGNREMRFEHRMNLAINMTNERLKESNKQKEVKEVSIKELKESIVKIKKERKEILESIQGELEEVFIIKHRKYDWIRKDGWQILEKEFKDFILKRVKDKKDRKIIKKLRYYYEKSNHFVSQFYIKSVKINNRLPRDNWDNIIRILNILIKHKKAYLIEKGQKELKRLTKCLTNLDGSNPCVMICEKCGLSLKIGSVYCSECGCKLGV